MFKVLIIIFVFFFVLSKIGGFIFRTLFGAAAQRTQQQEPTTRKPASGNVHIDYAPKQGEKSPKNFKGGDYVDFEEIKE